MSADPIVEEVRRKKDQSATEFNCDPGALVQYLQEKQREHPERVVLVPRPSYQRAVGREDSGDYGRANTIPAPRALSVVFPRFGFLSPM
jgi:hypothetical protein